MLINTDKQYHRVKKTLQALLCGNMPAAKRFVYGAINYYYFHRI